MIPAFIDFISATLQYMALNFIPASVMLMMRGGNIIMTYIYSKFLLKMKINTNQTMGAFLALTGIIIVGISNIAFSTATDDFDTVIYS
jgi:drug/metabolite transporter (DMT)-like permease